MVAWLLRALWYRDGVWMESGKNGEVENDCCVYRISFHDDGNVLILIMVMVVQLHEYIKKLSCIQWKVDFIATALYIYKAFMKSRKGGKEEGTKKNDQK